MRTRSDTISTTLRKGETEKVEFKESFGREALETLSAFANTSGGKLLLGVNDKGTVTGVASNRHTLKDIANQIDQGTALQPALKLLRVGGKEIILIEVPESKIKPVMVRGRAYRRVGSTTRQMGVFEEKNGFRVTFSTTPHIVPRQPESKTVSSTQSATQSTDPVKRLLSCLLLREMSSSELRKALNIKHRPTFRENYLHPALAANLIEMTIPDKPNSRLQKYRITEVGKSTLQKKGG